MEIIYKRHANRRLYDTEQSRQVALDEVAARIAAGHTIKVIDQTSGQDLTIITLAQIVAQKATELENVPELAPVLMEIIRKGGDTMFNMLKNVMFASVGAAYMTKEKAEEIVNELIAKGQLSKEEKAQKVKELMEKAEEKVKEFSSYVESQAKRAVDALHSGERKEIESLRAQVEELRRQVESMKNKG